MDFDLDLDLVFHSVGSNAFEVWWDLLFIASLLLNVRVKEL